MTKKHTYEYKQFLQYLPDFRSKGGGCYLLRRDDGKLVKCHNKRFRQLDNEGRIIYPQSKKQVEQQLNVYCNFMDQVIEQ